jgi:hypothetical protein
LPIAAALPSDVELGLQVLRTQFPEFRKSKVSVPVILMNQLYAIVSDRTQVDRELVRSLIPWASPPAASCLILSLPQDQLKRKGEIRSFKVHLKTNEFAVLFVEDYRAQIAAERRQLVANQKEDSPIFGAWGHLRSVVGMVLACLPCVCADTFVNTVLPATQSDEYIPKERLVELLFAGQPADEEQIMYATPARGQAWHTTCTLTRSIRVLVNAGVLIRDMRVEVEGEGFWFSVPNIGAFMKCCVKGRQEVIAILKRQKHKELLQEVHSSPPPLLSRGSGSCSP